jgi:predicted nucleic acid-binding protein
LSGIVVDASVALAWCFPDEGSEYAEAVLIALEGRSILVPSVWALEISNAVMVAERRKRITAPEIRRFVQLLEVLTIHEKGLPVAESVRNVLPVAREYGLSAYNASYLEVAMRHGAALATLDKGLEKAGRKAGVEILAGPMSPKLKR